MDPEKEWAYDEKLDQLSFHLQQLVLEVFITVVEKLKERNQPLRKQPVNTLEDEIKF